LAKALARALGKALAKELKDLNRPDEGYGALGGIKVFRNRGKKEKNRESKRDVGHPWALLDLSTRRPYKDI
jgi:hypothetical protein